jgi:hypothetical protein
MVSNQYYDLSFDMLKNQINWKVKGYWSSAKNVPNMEKDWDDVISKAIKPGFNILADLSDMKTPPEDVNNLHTKVQQKIIKNGVHKIATITSSSLLKVVVSNIGTKSGVNQLSASFPDMKSGQEWLSKQ